MTRSPLGRRTRHMVGIGLLLLSLVVLGACNYRWVAVLSTFQFKTMEFVSAFPAHRDAEGNYERQCIPEPGRKANALLFSVNMVGTETNVTGGDPSDKDNDTSIRPGDLVKKGASDRAAVREGDTITTGHFVLDIDCLESYPDSDLAGNAECQGSSGPQDVEPNQLAYRRLFQDVYRPSPKERDALAVAIMLDQSGSMKGFVDAESLLEVIGGNSGPWQPDFGKDGTDPDNTRFTAVKSFMALLNANDRAAIFEFSETTGQNAKIVCDLLPDGTEEQRRTECFGSNHKLFTNSTAFSALQGSPKGRTPLWQSLADVYGFMRDQGRAEVRHIIVITDGPDTCHPSSPDFRDTMRWFKGGKYTPLNQPSCSEIDYDHFLDVLMADMKDGSGNWIPQAELPVHIHFVQIQAPGYRERDARQQEVACLTGGHYAFINAQDLSSLGANASRALQTAISGSMQRLRGSLAGNWTLAVDLADLANDRLPMGANVAVQGTIKLLDGPVTPEAQSMLRVGYVDATSSANSIPTLDLRGAFRVPCEAGDSCEWYPLDDEGCENRACRAADRVCASSWKDTGTACGEDHSCCWGECQTFDDSCATRDGLCNIDESGCTPAE